MTMRVDQRDTIADVWLEAQIDADGIGLTLVSESPDVGAVVEAVDHYTFEELQDMEGEMFNLNLSGNAREILTDTSEDARIARMLQSESLEDRAEHLPENPSSDELLTYMGLTDAQSESDPRPEIGTVVEDTNPPSWSQDNRLRVVGYPDESADEYVVEESAFSHSPDRTVFDANPFCDPDEPVVECIYQSEFEQGDGEADDSDIYAFPASRVEDV